MADLTVAIDIIGRSFQFAIGSFKHKKRDEEESVAKRERRTGADLEAEQEGEETEEATENSGDSTRVLLVKGEKANGSSDEVLKEVTALMDNDQLGTATSISFRSGEQVTEVSTMKSG